MSYVRKRALRSGKVRWQVIWDEVGGRSARARTSEVFDTYGEAKERLRAIAAARPRRSAPFKVLTKQFLDHFEKLVEKGERERSTLRQLRQHINLHILTDAEFTKLKCSEIDTPAAQMFLDRLIERVSPKMATKVRGTLSRIFAHGARRGFVVGNPIASSKLERRTRPDAGEAEHFVLPPKDDLRDLLKTAKSYDNSGRAEAVVRLLMFGGLRMSELLGLWLASCALVAKAPNVRIVQRADRYNVIGPVKSLAGRRTVEIGEDTVKALCTWAEARPSSKLLFPNEEGNVWSYANFWHRFWVPLLNAAGLVTVEPASKTVREWSEAQADFKQPGFGPHMLRHVYASLQIEQGVTPKRLQKLMGHSTLKLTLDTYGHLWPDESADRARARAVEKAL
ncbi:MAG: site-specific integrase [Rhizomicrobium sp.]|jgi:integrase